MRLLSDKDLMKVALNVYARHLRGLDNQYLDDLKRVEELQAKKVVANDLAIVIKLEI